MADLEVRKHVKKSLHILKRKDKGFWHKIKEFLLEIFIIVFAVSLSIWLHGLSEKHHKAEEVKEFLTDLKADLQADKENIKKNKKMLIKEVDSYKTEKKDNIKISKKTKKKSLIFIITANTNINSGNYQGFKSSGNIAFILDKPLKRKILQYYEQETKRVEDQEKQYNNQMEKVFGIILSQGNYLEVNHFFLNRYRNSLIESYDKLTIDIDNLIKDINQDIK